jgi:hypothetical protein
MQTCTYPAGGTKDWSCEQIAKYNSEHCGYAILRWKKIIYEEELAKCKNIH